MLYFPTYYVFEAFDVEATLKMYQNVILILSLANMLKVKKIGKLFEI